MRCLANSSCRDDIGSFSTLISRQISKIIVIAKVSSFALIFTAVEENYLLLPYHNAQFDSKSLLILFQPKGELYVINQDVANRLYYGRSQAPKLNITVKNCFMGSLIGLEPFSLPSKQH